MQFLALALIPLVLGSPLTPRKEEALTYDGFEGIRVDITDKAKAYDALSSIKYEELGHSANKYIDIALPPAEAAKFKKLGIKWEEKMKNIGDAVRKEKFGKWKGHKRPDKLPNESWFDSFHDYDDHVQFWKDLRSAFPANSELFSSGKSLEGRDMFGLKLKGAGRRNKKAVIWHGQVHAREWITGMTLEYITWNMINEYKKRNIEVRQILEKYDIYVIPFINPDGFVYSVEIDRLYRKNRQAPPPGANQTCFGVDLNRNWPHQWDTNPEGSSTDPCSQAYRGTSPGSEPEMKYMKGFVDKIARQQGIKLYIDWHSYGNYILSPWGYTCAALPQDSAQLVSLGEQTAQVIEAVNGQNLTTGPTCQTLYAVNGGSLDYVYDVAKADLSYAFELRDQGQFGFVLPPDQIKPTGEEHWQGMLYLLQNM